MSKIIKLPHLEEVIEDLVNKLKVKFNQTVVSVEFNPDTDIVTVTKDGGATTTFSLEKFVDTWGDLDCVTEYSHANLFDYSSRVEGRKYEENGNITQNDSGTSSVEIEVVGGTEYSIFRQHNDNHNIVFYDAADMFIEADIQLAPVIRNWHRKVVNAPLNAVKMGVNFRKGGTNSPNMMVIKGNVIDTLDTHIPYLDGGRISIGDCVSISFNNDGTTLASTTHASAIKELDNKVATLAGGTVTSVNNVKPNTQGNVTIDIQHIANLENTLNGKVDTNNLTQFGGNQHALKIPQLGNDGKLHLSMLPDISINKVHAVADENAAEQLIAAGTARVGDIFIVEDQNNAVYMYVDDQGADFGTKCVELTMANGTVKSVNGEFADPTGNILLTADEINLSNGMSNVEEELNKRLVTINNQQGTQGNIDLSLEVVNNDRIDFKVGSHVFGTVPYITSQQVTDIINLFV